MRFTVNIKNKYLWIILAALLILVALVIFYPGSKQEDYVEEEFSFTPQKSFEGLFGIDTTGYDIRVEQVKKNETLGTILAQCGIPVDMVYRIVQASKDVHNLEQIVENKKFTIFTPSKSEDNRARVIVYQPNEIDYVVVDLRDSLVVYKQAKEVSLRERVISGEITSSLSAAVDLAGGSQELVVEMSEIYAWTIDFFRLQKGDRFKVIYNERFIDGEVYAGLESITAIEFTHAGQDYYAFRYPYDGDENAYFDPMGKSLKKAFLKAPVKYSRISSTFNPRRYHPILKTVRPHYGTDYAAPHGTPIMSTANGTIIEIGRTTGNGNYIKIRHNSVYTTQYLHMSRFAKGMARGTRVNQGDVIGYVGSTGYATGPHVCYRLWKNGVQVNSLTEKFPEAESIDTAQLEQYKAFIMPLQQRLERIKGPDMATEDFDQKFITSPLDILEELNCKQ